jgi:hypothetical protein
MGNPSRYPYFKDAEQVPSEITVWQHLVNTTDFDCMCVKGSDGLLFCPITDDRLGITVCGPLSGLDCCLFFCFPEQTTSVEHGHFSIPILPCTPSRLDHVLHHDSRCTPFRWYSVQSWTK